MSNESENGKIVDFESGKQEQLHRRKEAKVDAMRRAFSLARGGDPDVAPGKRRKKRRKPAKK